MEQGRAWLFDLMRRYGFEADRGSRRLAVCVLIVAWGVTWAGLMQQPLYRAEVLLLVDLRQQQWWANSGGSGEELQTLEYRDLPVETVLHAIDSRPVAEEAIQRLGLKMTPEELLDDLAVEQLGGTRFIQIDYTGPNPAKNKKIANAVGQVAAELISERSGDLVAKVNQKAKDTTDPISPRPYRNGLLVLFAGLALSSGPIAPARAALAAAAGKLGECVRVVAVQGVGLAWARRRDRSIIERVNEKKLLLALGRRGRLTVAQAALEAGVTTEEADRILSELAYRGHLQFDIEHGARVYSFWPRPERR